MSAEPVTLAVSEWGRPIVWIATASWYGGKVSSRNVFSTREEAIRWAKFSARQAGSGIDWHTWTAPQPPDRIDEHGNHIVSYPYETARDDIRLTPTFIASWPSEGGGQVQVEKFEVCGVFDWAADKDWERE